MKDNGIKVVPEKTGKKKKKAKKSRQLEIESTAHNKEQNQESSTIGNQKTRSIKNAEPGPGDSANTAVPETSSDFSLDANQTPGSSKNPAMDESRSSLELNNLSDRDFNTNIRENMMMFQVRIDPCA